MIPTLKITPHVESGPIPNPLPPVTAISAPVSKIPPASKKLLPLLTVAGVAGGASLLWVNRIHQSNVKKSSPIAGTVATKPTPSLATPPVATVGYKSSCLNNDSACPEPQTLAAFYDYVGSVYGDEGRVEFDGRLQPSERAYVEQTFGALVHFTDTGFYLSRARNQFFNRTSIPSFKDTGCNPRSTFKATRVMSPTLGDAFIMGGAHACGEVFGDLYSKVELEVASDPQKWAFFIEGYDTISKLGMMSGPHAREMVLFYRIASTLGIPAIEAIPQPQDKKVIEVLESKFGITPADSAARLAVLSFQSQIGPNDDPLQILSECIARTSGLFDLPSDQVTAAVVPFISRPPVGVDPNAYQRDLQNRLREYQRLYSQVANDLVPDSVKAKLAHLHKSKALFQLGAHHAPAVQQIYEVLANGKVQISALVDGK